MSDADRSIILYDGVCALCNAAVRFVLARDHAKQFYFAPLSGSYAAAVRDRYPATKNADSIVLVDIRGSKEAVFLRSDAAIAIAGRLGAPWSALSVTRVLPRALRDAVYDMIARHRYGLFGKYDACPLPDPGVRDRFLD